jgi:organic radical activating enzyme
MYDLGPLCDALHEMDLHVFLETSGAYPLNGDFDWVCVSPKKFKGPLPAFLQRADELKVVIFHPSDFQWAEEHAEATNDDCFLYLQPEWEKSSTILPIIIEYVKQNPKWQISLQTHKWMNIP